MLSESSIGALMPHDACDCSATPDAMCRRTNIGRTKNTARRRFTYTKTLRMCGMFPKPRHLHAFKPCSIVKYVGASPAKRPCPGAIDHTSYIEAVIIHPGARNSVGTYVQEIIPNQIKSYEKIIPPPSLEEQDVFM